MSKTLKFVPLTDALAAYVDAHRTSVADPLLKKLRQETAQLENARMQVSADQGDLLAILVAATGAKTCVEIGTFTGYSSTCMARALPPEGKLHCFDISAQYTGVARRYWKEAGIADRIELHLGPAGETLARHCPARVDFAFIDADKTGYDAYYEFLLPRVTSGGGLMVFDNMLSHGRVVEEAEQNEDVQAICALNDKLTADPRVQVVLLSAADGMMLVRKR
ncbi:MAG: class I SAM-dependent methyltransferase [Phycisphaeraceae bacterium]|nr:class I SAM-dependent methyltransferase [Phycisphaeraceae bacterium]